MPQTTGDRHDGAVAGGPFSARVLEVFTGRVAPLAHGSTSVPSGLVKTPVGGPTSVGVEGLDGDEQADRRHHGGPAKALLLVPAEHYDAANAGPAASLPVGSLGENLSTRGLVETQVCLGDVYAVGQVLLRVTQPRRPCFKLGARHGVPDLAARLQSAGHTGFYCSVLRPGTLRAGDVLVLADRRPHPISVAEVNRVMNVDRADRAGIERLLDAGDDLPTRWREQLRDRLARPGHLQDDAARLTATPPRCPLPR